MDAYAAARRAVAAFSFFLVIGCDGPKSSQLAAATASSVSLPPESAPPLASAAPSSSSGASVDAEVLDAKPATSDAAATVKRERDSKLKFCCDVLSPYDPEGFHPAVMHAAGALCARRWREYRTLEEVEPELKARLMKVRMSLPPSCHANR